MNDHLKKLVANGFTKRAINTLLEHFKIANDNDVELYNKTIIISAKHEKYLKAKGLGIISFEEQNIVSAQINHALLGIIDKVVLCNSLELTSSSSSVSRNEHVSYLKERGELICDRIEEYLEGKMSKEKSEAYLKVLKKLMSDHSNLFTNGEYTKAHMKSRKIRNTIAAIQTKTDKKLIQFHSPVRILSMNRVACAA